MHVVIRKSAQIQMYVCVCCGRGNIKDASTKRDMQKYLSKCHYHEDEQPYCPNFRLGYIADQARENFSELCKTVSSAQFDVLML